MSHRLKKCTHLADYMADNMDVNSSNRPERFSRLCGVSLLYMGLGLDTPNGLRGTSLFPSKLSSHKPKTMPHARGGSH